MPATGTLPPKRSILVGLQSLPAVAAVAYGILLALGLERALAAVYSNSDAASPSVIAQCLGTRDCGGGQATLGHIGYYTTLWFDLLTRSLPFHRIVWQFGPYALSLAAALILGWTVYRLAGAWAGTTAFAIATAASTATLYANLAQAFHGTTWFATVVLGAFVTSEAKPHARSRWWTAALVVLSIGVFAGANLASDPLLAVAAVAPLVLTPAVLWLRSGRRLYGRLVAVSGTTALVTVVFAFGTEATMRAFGLTSSPMGSGSLTSRMNHLGGRTVALVGDLGALAGIGSLEGATGGRLALRLLALTLVLSAVTFVLTRALVAPKRAGGERGTVHVTYWSTSALLLVLAFLLSGVPLGSGTPSSRYLVGVTYACAAVLPVLMCRTVSARVLAAAAVATFAAFSCASLLAGELPALKSHLPVVRFGPSIVRALEALGIRRGYAEYWKAAPLTWQSSGRVLVAPVHACDHGRSLCPYRLNSISGWYQPRAHQPSFLLTEPATDGFGGAVRSLGSPRATERFGPMRLLIYRSDISSRFMKG